MDAKLPTTHSLFAKVMERVRAYWPAWLPLLPLLAVSAVVLRADLDRTLTRWFWCEDIGWWLAEARWVTWLYRFGNWPALATACAGLLVFLGSLRWSPLLSHRRRGLFLALVLVVGPGIIVNSISKCHYGRPRPRQVVEFGGSSEFRPLGSPTFEARQRSFPSGHASMGFYWLALAVLCWRFRRKAALAWLLLALVHGGVMGLCRMAQGAHWLSDILWAGGSVYYTALILHRVLLRSSGRVGPPPKILPQ